MRPRNKQQQLLNAGEQSLSPRWTPSSLNNSYNWKKKMMLQNVLHKFCCPRSLHSQSKGSKYLKKPDSYGISSSHFQISAITQRAASITLDRSPPLQQLNVQTRLGAWGLSQVSSNVFQWSLDREKPASSDSMKTTTIYSTPIIFSFFKNIL